MQKKSLSGNKVYPKISNNGEENTQPGSGKSFLLSEVNGREGSLSKKCDNTLLKDIYKITILSF